MVRLCPDCGTETLKEMFEDEKPLGYTCTSCGGEFSYGKVEDVPGYIEEEVK